MTGAPGAVVVDHPVVAHRVAELRDAGTGRDRFRALVRELSAFVAYEALRDLATVPVEVVTPVAAASGLRVADRVLVVPVLRAGLGMVEGVQSVAPHTEVAHLGMRRDEATLAAVTYLDGLPEDLTGRRVAICDPMLATGGSMVQAVQLVAARGAARIDVLCLLASVPGVGRVRAAFPYLVVHCAALDGDLDARGYIVPGLGDAGDRLWGPPRQRSVGP